MAERKFTEPAFTRLLYLDMDGVLVNFLGSKRIPESEKEKRDHPAMYEPGFFAELEPNPGAIEAVQALMLSGKYEVWIATKPLWNSAYCYSEKVQWVMRYFPQLAKRIVMTQNKSYLIGNYLVDDDLTNLGFDGTFILFDPKQPKKHWQSTLEVLL